MNKTFISLWVIAGLSVVACPSAFAADAKPTKEIEAAERIKQSGKELREDIQRIRETRIRVKEEQKRMQEQEAADRKREAAARAEQNRLNVLAMAEARRQSVQKARELLAAQEKARLEAEARAALAEAKAAKAERERQILLAERLAKLEREEMLVKERAAKYEVDSACMDDPDPNCAAKSKAIRERLRAQKAR